MRALPEYLDRDGLVKYFPMLREGDDSLTAYVLSVADEAGWEIPEDLRNRMERALIGFVEGRVVRYSPLPTADLAIRKIAAIEALSRGKEPIEPRWLDSIAIEPNLWPTSAVIDWYLLLKRSPASPKRDERLEAREQHPALAPQLPGHDDGVLDREERRAVVADGLGRRQREPPAARAAGRRRTGARTCRGSCAARSGACSAGAGTRRSPTRGARWRSTSSRQRSKGRPHRHDDRDIGRGALRARLAARRRREDVREAPGVAGRAWRRRRSRRTAAGKPWVTLQSIAAIPLKAPLSSGYRIARDVTPVQQKTKGRWTRGDVARVRLEVDAQSDMTWVVVDDPIPAGATVLGRGLGGDSTLLTQGEKRQGHVWPAFEERTFESFRAYYQFVPKGRFVVEYTVRLNNAGEFQLAADARRGDVRAGDVRRAAERGLAGGAMSMANRHEDGRHDGRSPAWLAAVARR